MYRRAGILCGLLLYIAGAGAAPAQESFPNRLVRLVVPTSPGAVTDVMARALAAGLSQSWGQQVIVDNRPGADEMIGIGAVAKSAADGYTLLVTSNSGITTAPHLHSQMRYDPQKDLTPIFMLGQVTPVMVVPAASPARSVRELIAFAKSRPGEFNYGSFGNGSYSHVAMEDFKRRTGIQIMHIPYRGATPAYTAMLRNEIAVMFANLSGATGHADAGNVRIIAAAGPRRSTIRPDLPTVAESGVDGFSTGAWWGLFGPASLPQPVFDRIRKEIAALVAKPEMQKIFAANTMELVPMSPQQMVGFIQDDLDHWGRQLRAAGINPN